MSKLSSWSLAEKLHASNKKGIITGLIIALVAITLVVLIIVKLKWIKNRFGCTECDFEIDDDFDLDFDDEDSLYTSEADFV